MLQMYQLVLISCFLHFDQFYNGIHLLQKETSLSKGESYFHPIQISIQNMKLYQFNKVNSSSRLFSRASDLTSHRQLARYTILGMNSFKSNYTAVGYSYDLSATIIPLGMACHAGHCCGLQVLTEEQNCSWWCCPLPPPLGSLHSILQYYENQCLGRRLPGQLQLDSSKSYVHNVWYLQQQGLYFNSGRQPLTMAIAWIVVGISWIPLTNNLNGYFPCLVLGFLFRLSVATGRSIIITLDITSFTM